MFVSGRHQEKRRVAVNEGAVFQLADPEVKTAN
jgi:hypothetical protein